MQQPESMKHIKSYTRNDHRLVTKVQRKKGIRGIVCMLALIGLRSGIRAGDSSPGPPRVSVQKAWEAFRTEWGLDSDGQLEPFAE